MSENCDHSKYSASYDVCSTPGHPDDCIVTKCDNCNAETTHDFATFDVPTTEANTSLGQQFREILFYGGAKDALNTTHCETCLAQIPKETAAKNNGMCDECDSAWGSGTNEEDEDGYRCRVCNKWSATSEENMNHRCFE